MKHLDGYTGDESAIIADFLIRVGGKNPAGYPHYRLVDSEKILEKKGAVWHDWDENLTSAERSPFVRKIIPVLEKVRLPENVRKGSGADEAEVIIEKSVLLPGNKPIRIVAEVREVPKYSHLDEQGWILERWYPAAMFGAQEDWYSHLVPGTTLPRLGPYPEDGLYEMICGPFRQYPALSFLEQFMAFQIKRGRELQEQDVRQSINDRMHAAEEAESKRRAELEKKILDRLSPLTSTSLEAGRWRNEMAEKSGIRSHMGN